MTSNSTFDEHRWVIQIRQTLHEELEEDTEIPVTIFNVPKTLIASNPDSYIPQQVALGPYHYWRPEFSEMERYKISAAKRIQKQLQNLKLQHLVDQLTKLEPRIRACYHKNLDFNGETLAWMMALDASFMLEFLQVYAVNKDTALVIRNTTRMSHLVDYARRKSSHNAILRDLVMLENQIPLFLLTNTLEFQFSSLQMGDELLHSMLIGLCKELSPFKKLEELQIFQVTGRAHVLDVLYHMIVPKLEQPLVVDAEDQTEVKEGEENTFEKSIYVKLVYELWNTLWSNSDTGPMGFLKRMILSKPVKVVLKLPWSIIYNLRSSSENKQDAEPENENSNSRTKNNIDKAPLVDEISIPSVTKLSRAGVRFSPINGGIQNIFFDHKTFTLYLPTISLDVNTAVVLRNLVAYEACNAAGPLVVTRYTELMNGIIDSKEDAKVLRERGIIWSHLKSDEEVAEVWNGMSKSVRLTKVASLDKMIEDVNRYYNGRWTVKAGRVMKVYVFSSWRFLTLLATVLLMLMTTVQAVCSVYRCGPVFHVKNIQ